MQFAGAPGTAIGVSAAGLPTRIRESGGMRAVALACAAMVLLAGHAGFATQAAEPTDDVPRECRVALRAGPLHGEPNAALVIVVNAPGPPSGTITAYGSHNAYSNVVTEAAESVSRSVHVWGVTVHAGEPIEAVTFARPGSSCPLFSIVHGSPEMVPGTLRSPPLQLTRSEPLEPLECATPYAEARILKAAEVTTPAEAEKRGIKGPVTLVVGLDVRGMPLFAVVTSSPSALLNAEARRVALQNTYSAAIFRCRPRSGMYLFEVEFQ